MADKKILCPCRKVSKKEVKEAIRNGADSYKAVKKMTKLGTSCGKCKSKAKKYIKKQLKKEGK